MTDATAAAFHATCARALAGAQVEAAFTGRTDEADRCATDRREHEAFASTAAALAGVTVRTI